MASQWFTTHGPAIERFFVSVMLIAQVPSFGMTVWLLAARQIKLTRALRMNWPGLLLGIGYVAPSVFALFQRSKSRVHRLRRRIRSAKSQKPGIGLSKSSPTVKERKFGLDESDREIRLLRFICPDKDGQIHIESIKFSLSEEPTYYALSYQWGDTSHRSVLLMDGYEVDVSSVLYEVLRALRHFQPGNEATMFWIDALSINQRDGEERSSQVRQMKDIYRMATKVIVWLGPPSEESEMALAKMRALEACLYIATTSPDTDTTSNNKITRESYYMSVFPSNDATEAYHLVPWRAIYSVLNNGWWVRAWIAQEVSSETAQLSPVGNVEIILGRQLQTISLRSTLQLMVFVNAMIESWETASQEETELITQLKQHTFRINRLVSIGKLRKTSSVTQTIYSFLTTGSGTAGEQQLWREKVWPILNLFRGLEASDARDKVYAALPLVLPDHHPAFEPDYRLSIEQVYGQVTQYFIRYQRNLDILTTCNSGSSDLATFITDWRTPVHYNPLCTFVDVKKCPVFQACAHTLPDVTFHEEPVTTRGDKDVEPSPQQVMSVRGMRIDMIRQVSMDHPSSSQFRRSKWESILNDLDPHYGPTNESLVNAYQRLLVADIRETELLELNGFRGTFLQRAAVWFEMIIEASVSNWLRQADRMPPSYSILQQMNNERLKRWRVHYRGARVTPNLDLNTPWSAPTHPNLERSTEQMSSSTNSPTAATSPTLDDDKASAHGINKFNPEGNSSEGHEDEKLSPGAEEIPDTVLSTTEPEGRKFAVEKVRELISYVTINRTLCVSNKGYIALVPQQSRPTDLLVILFGGKTPFVVRQVQDQGAAHMVRYQLIGEAYVHGVMDGEMLQGLSESEIEARSEMFTVI